jgi:hypothetical protein
MVEMLVELRNAQQHHDRNERALDHVYEADSRRLKDHQGHGPPDFAVFSEVHDRSPHLHSNI